MLVITIKGKSYDVPDDGKVRPSDDPGKTWVQVRHASAPVEVDADLNEVIDLITTASFVGRPLKR
jgi:hypothetical protein